MGVLPKRKKNLDTEAIADSRGVVRCACGKLNAEVAQTSRIGATLRHMATALMIVNLNILLLALPSPSCICRGMTLWNRHDNDVLLWFESSQRNRAFNGSLGSEMVQACPRSNRLCFAPMLQTTSEILVS